MAAETSSAGWRSERGAACTVRVIRVPSPQAATEIVYSMVTELIARRSSASIGLATGGTFSAFFDRLVTAENDGRVDLRHVGFTHLDEYVGCGPDTQGGMVHELNQRLFHRLDRGTAFFKPAPATEDDPATAHRAMLDGMAPLDLQLLGIGRNGHVAFNEPGTTFEHRCHVTDLAADTIDANADRFPDAPHPERALTMGPAAILEARQLCLVATGAAKADAVRAMLQAPVSPDCPASIIRLHENATVIIDDAAAAKLDDDAALVMERPESVVWRRGDLAPRGPVVVIAPHPDDASISCGGLLASLNEDVERHIVTMTTGARARVPGDLDKDAVTTLREDEVAREAAALDADAVFLRCAFYDSGVFSTEDVDRVVEVLSTIKPSWILAPARTDPHPTHRMSRLVVDEAVARHLRAHGDPLEVWTYEGAWHQHAPDDINALMVFDADAEDVKLQAVKAHASQLARVPFDEGAKALARLRAVSFSETHFGGTEVGAITDLPLVEAYVRERYTV